LIKIDKYKTAYEFLKSKFHEQPKMAIILGSGLGVFAESLEKKTAISTAEIPGYPKSTVSGHSGKIVFGYINDYPILVFQGRIHFYEGYDISDVIFPAVITYLFGIDKIIITNVSGGINFKPGDIVLLQNHISVTFKDPLKNLDFIPEEKKLSLNKEFYDHELIEISEKVAKDNNLEIKKGAYLWTLGPNYETPAEIQSFKIMGADMVGMSTVPEVIACYHLGVKTLGISFISNYAAGIVKQKLAHEDVIEMGERHKLRLNSLIQKLIIKILDKN
jgi:purine-nucleoside phosphorylase